MEVPACAGMTLPLAGMTLPLAGMTLPLMETSGYQVWDFDQQESKYQCIGRPRTFLINHSSFE